MPSPEPPPTGWSDLSASLADTFRGYDPSPGYAYAIFFTPPTTFQVRRASIRNKENRVWYGRGTALCRGFTQTQWDAVLARAFQILHPPNHEVRLGTINPLADPQ